MPFAIALDTLAPMQERLHTTKQAGELLGGIHRNQVGFLIRSGKLSAVEMPLSGSTRPRHYVRASDLRRFIKSLKSLEIKDPPNHTPIKYRKVKAQGLIEYV